MEHREIGAEQLPEEEGMKDFLAEVNREARHLRNNFGRLPINQAAQAIFIDDGRRVVNPGNSRKIRRER
jgi:hypothetical protein